jgi:hypothetical protein
MLVGCGVAVAGCTGAVETFRSVRGFNKNDPDPVAAPFTGNMAAAEAAPYPNLASVPPPPTQATSAAERQKLTEKLVAERAAAQAAAGAPAAAPSAPATAAAAPNIVPESPLRLAAAAPQTITAAKTAPGSASEPSSASARLAAAMPTHRATGDDATGPQRSAADTSNPALPRDSDLQMPQVRSLPEPDDPRPAPPPPRLPPVPPPVPSSQLPAAALASVTPQQPPSVPELPPVAPPPAPGLATPALTKTEPPRTAGVTTVAMLDAADAEQLDPAQITQIAARYQARLGSEPPLRAVRIIVYTTPPAPGTDPLAGYHETLERAQGIAKVLTEAGIPEKMIQTEAKPATGPIATARVEIQFLP